MSGGGGGASDAQWLPLAHDVEEVPSGPLRLSSGSASGAASSVDEAGALAGAGKESLKWSTGEIMPPCVIGVARARARRAVAVVAHRVPRRSGADPANDGSLQHVDVLATPGSAGALGDASWRIDRDEVQLIKEIGRGSFGAVYTAKLRSMNVAVKKLYADALSDDELLADFSQEVRVRAAAPPRRTPAHHRASQVSIMTKLRHPVCAPARCVPCAVADARRLASTCCSFSARARSPARSLL